MKNIHILPTDKPSRFYINARYKHYEFCELPRISTAYKKCHNIYIICDEEIKQGDWVLGDFPDKPICKVISKYGEEFTAQSLNGNKHGLSQYDSKKIILTTDQDLIKDGVQAIPEYFLKWFIEKANDSGKAIDIIETKSHLDSNYFDNGKINYQIIIPKEEQKKPFYCSNRLELYENERCITQCDHCAPKEKLLAQNLIDMMKEDEELGLYEETDHLLSTEANKERLLEDVFNDEKRQGVKELIDAHKQGRDKIENDFLKCISDSKVVYEPKQETLEEVAERLYATDYGEKSKNIINIIKQEAFIRGAKWQQEQMFNLIKELHDNENITGFSKLAYAKCLDIIEQFKKK